MSRRARQARGQQSLFTPGFGSRPHMLAGRAVELDLIEESVLAAQHRPDSGNLILGQRGFGKTALLNEIEDLMAAEGWVVLSTDASSPGLPERILAEAAKHPFVREVMDASQPIGAESTARAASRGLRLRWAEMSSQTSATMPGPSVRDTLEVLGVAASEQGTGVLLTVDELHAGERDEMVRMASDLQHVAARGEIPVAFAGAALPEVLHAMLRDPRLSFFRRCDQHSLGRVSDQEIDLFFERSVKDGGGALTSEARHLLVEKSDGYPYRMQLLGRWAWRHADAPAREITVDDVVYADMQASSIIRQRVHAHIWQNISDEERALIRAVSDLGGEANLWDVSDMLPSSPAAINDMIARLVAVGAISYDGSDEVILGPLMDTVFVNEATAALRAIEQHREPTVGGAARRPARRQAQRRCNKPMKRVPGRCIRPAGHAGRCRSR